MLKIQTETTWSLEDEEQVLATLRDLEDNTGWDGLMHLAQYVVSMTDAGVYQGTAYVNSTDSVNEPFVWSDENEEPEDEAYAVNWTWSETTLRRPTQV